MTCCTLRWQRSSQFNAFLQSPTPVTKPTDIRLLEVAAETELIAFRTPIKFGGRVVTEAVLFNVTVQAETRSGRRGTGLGSMPIGNVWGGPSKVTSTEQSLAAMEELSHRLVKVAAAYKGTGHPLEITHEIAASYQATADAVARDQKLSEPYPRLAQLVAASPIEAAIHDAQGKALGQNSYNLLGPEFVSHDLATYLTP